MRWLARRWRLALLCLVAIGGAVLYVVTRGAINPRDWFDTEIDAIDVNEKLRNLEIKHGLAAAQAESERRYLDRKEELTERQRRKADALRNDPAALGAFLVRAAR